MTNLTGTIDRRSFVRSASVLVVGVLSAVGTSLGFTRVATAAAGDGCCNLVYTPDPYCGWYCGSVLGYPYAMKYWPCNNGKCKCWECTTNSSGLGCYSGTFACSYNSGTC